MCAARTLRRIQAVAVNDSTIVCSMIGDRDSGIYVVQPKAAPRHLVDARASLLVLSGTTLYWIEESDRGWLVRTTSL